MNRLRNYKGLITACVIFLNILSIRFAVFGNTPRTLLWEISGNGLETPSYLFGTIHALCPEEFKVPDVVINKMEQTAQLSLEVDMDAPNFMAELMQGATLPDGKKLSSILSPDDYTLLAEHLASTMQLDLKCLTT